MDWEARTVSQYGVDYIYLSCNGSYNLNFEGVTEVGVLELYCREVGGDRMWQLSYNVRDASPEPVDVASGDGGAG